MSFSLSFSSRVFLFRFEPQSLSLVLTDPSFLSLSIRSSLLRTSTCSLSLAFMPGLSFFPLFASYFSTPPRGFVPVLLRVPFSQPFSLPPFTRNSLSVPVRRRVSPFLSAPRSAPFTNGSVSVRMGATRRRGGAAAHALPPSDSFSFASSFRFVSPFFRPGRTVPHRDRRSSSLTAV